MIIEEREALMVSSNGDVDAPILKKNAHFLKPTLNPTIELLPKHPSSSLPSTTNIKVRFKGKPMPQKNWHLWVGNLQQTHESTWKKAGIFDAIRASTYNLKKDNVLIKKLAEYWCDETKSFVFSWGECTITLEDIMILGGFSVIGENVLAPFKKREIEEIENNLMNSFPEKRKNSIGQIDQTTWMDHFMDVGGDLEHIALIVLWLSRYVFPMKHYCLISPHVVPIAICLARGTRIALAPAVLASLYHDMRLLKQKMVDFVNESWGVGGSNDKLVLWSPMQLVQLWAWERFPSLAPIPVTLYGGEPRLARWQNLMPVRDKLLMMNRGSFVWRPYALSIENWELPQFYGDDEERLVLLSSEVGEEYYSFARCLRPCELVGLDCIEQYLPHRVGMQFGLDQDIPCSIPRLNGCVELAWSTYDVSHDGVKLYLTPRLAQGAETVRYFTWSKTVFCVDNTSDSVFKQQSLDSNAIPLDNKKFDSFLASCPLHSVGEGFIEATTISSSDNHADNSEWLLSQCPRSANNKSDQNVNENVQGRHKKVRFFLSSSENVAVVSALNGDTGEKCTERNSEKNNSLNTICDDDDDENMPSLTLENATEMAVTGMDTGMEQLGKCRMDCGNVSSNGYVNNVEDENNETHTCNNMSPTISHANCYLGLPSQSTQRDTDEVANLMDSPIAGIMDDLSKIHEDMNCVETGTNSSLLEVNNPRDGLLAVDDDDHNVRISKVESDKKKICLVNAEGEQGKAVKSVYDKSRSVTLDNHVVIIDDDEGEKAQNDFDPVEVLVSKELEYIARLSKLEKTFIQLKAAKLKSKVK